MSEERTENSFEPGANCQQKNLCNTYGHCRRASALGVALMEYEAGEEKHLIDLMNKPSCGHKEETTVYHEINNVLKK